MSKGYYETRGRTGVNIKMNEYDRFGGKDKIIANFQDFYVLFMTDPFMNVLFDMKEPHDNTEHGRHLALFLLNFFGDDPEYKTLKDRSGSLTSSLNRAH